MYKTIDHSKHNYFSSSATNETLKQKKRLSFREPEVDVPRSFSSSNSNRIHSKQSALLALNADGPKQSASLEDLTLEDQTFIIAKHVGQAFDKRSCERRPLNIASSPKTSCSDPISFRRNGGFLRETLQNDCSHIGSGIQKNGSNSRVTFSSEDAGYFEALSPQVLNMSTMKFPAIEVSESISRPTQAIVAPTDMVTTSVKHQLQFLKYQLEQQRQQTQAALAHIQLLKDQLQAESSARFKAQTQNHQLMMQNKELLDHIQKLFQQIQDLEKLTEKQERKPTFPAAAAAAITTSASQESQEIRITPEAKTTKAAQIQKNNGEVQPVRTSTFAPNPTMANRRSSLTGLKPFQTKPNHLEQNNKRDDVRLNSRSSSPSPASQGRTPSVPDSAAESATNSHTGRSFLFNNLQKSNSNKDVSAKERNGNPTKERQFSTKTTEDLHISSIPMYNSTAKGTTAKTILKPSSSELTLRNENLIINDNPLIIEEKSPRKLEAYSSRKNHSSDSLPEYAGSKISSVALTPKYTGGGGWSKSPKLQNNGNGLSLALDSSDNFCVKENKGFSSGNTKLFNS